MTKKRVLATGALSIVLIFVLAACSGASLPTPTSAPSVTEPFTASLPTEGPAAAAPDAAQENESVRSASVVTESTGVRAASGSETDSGAQRQAASATTLATPEAQDGGSSVPALNPKPEAPKLEAKLELQDRVEPDPDYAKNMRAAGIGEGACKTDFSRHTVPYNTILSGGPPRDGIPPLDEPVFTDVAGGDEFLDPLEPVVSFSHDGDARAYPLQIMTWHEIVNDEVGGLPVAVTFCPLCNSAIVFDRHLDGALLTFGTSGKLRNSDLIMWDRQTESWWQQLTGEGIVGELAGKRLTFLPAAIVSWEDFKASYPSGQVLSQDTGFSRNYGRNPYAGYDRADNPPFLFRGDLDDRLLPKERVVSVTIGDAEAAFPFTALKEEGVINYNVGGRDLAVFYKPGTRSALGASSIGDAEKIGAAALFDASLDGRKLVFKMDAEKIVDSETGSVWNILGQATEGPLAGKSLTPIPHTNSFWFAVAAFKPDSKVYKGGG